MAETPDPSARHLPHGLRGPHNRNRLSPELRDELLRWLDETEADSDLSVRDVARFLSRYPPLEQAVRGMVGSALFGGLEPSSTTHAVAMLGVRAARRLLHTLAETPDHGSRPRVPA